MRLTAAPRSTWRWGTFFSAGAQVLGRHVAILLVEDLECGGRRDRVNSYAGPWPWSPSFHPIAEPGRLDRGSPAAPAPPGSRPGSPCGRARAARTRSASARRAGTRPTRAGTPTGPRGARSPSRTDRRRSAGCPRGTASAARRGRCGPGRGSALAVTSPPRRLLAQPVEVVGQRAGLELLALDPLALGALARGLEHLARRARARPPRRRRRRARATSPLRIVGPADA